MQTQNDEEFFKTAMHLLMGDEFGCFMGIDRNNVETGCCRYQLRAAIQPTLFCGGMLRFCAVLRTERQRSYEKHQRIKSEESR